MSYNLLRPLIIVSTCKYYIQPRFSALIQLFYCNYIITVIHNIRIDFGLYRLHACYDYNIIYCNSTKFMLMHNNVAMD